MHDEAATMDQCTQKLRIGAYAVSTPLSAVCRSFPQFYITGP
jgi:hypothetical protein